MGEVDPRAKFDVDLAFGELRETAFVAALRDCHVECKSDQKARSTGNVFIEIRQGSSERGKGRDSGLTTTRASWWAIEVFQDRWIVIRTSILKDTVRRVAQMERERGRRATVMGGDGGRFEGVLVPIRWLTEPFRTEQGGF